MVYSDSPLAHWCIRKRYLVKTDAIRYLYKKWLNISLLAWERETEQQMSNLRKKVGNSNLGNNWNLENAVEKRHEISLWELHHAPSPAHFTNSNLVFKKYPETQLLKQWQMLANINTLPGVGVSNWDPHGRSPFPQDEPFLLLLTWSCSQRWRFSFSFPVCHRCLRQTKGRLAAFTKHDKHETGGVRRLFPSGPGFTRTTTWVSDQSPNL